MVCFGIRVASLLGECLGVFILCCPSFLLFYDILNLTLTLYLQAKPSVETVVVLFTNLALILFPFTGSISLRSHREEDKGKLL